MPKWMWIIAGPNGAGKSSLAEQFLINLGHRKLVKLNADKRTVTMLKHSNNAMYLTNSDGNHKPVMVAMRANGRPIKLLVRDLNPAVDSALADMI
ncbi:MAG: hypothetical protein HQL61_16070 [Magnetococcales bacterium]|nr:hypothetical protein [Nitrospirota bacterium]